MGQLWSELGSQLIFWALGAVVSLWVAWRHQRRTRLAYSEPAESWVDGGLHAPVPIWNPFEVELRASRATVTLRHEEVSDQGLLIAAPDIRWLVSVVWPESEATAGLQGRLRSPAGPLAPLIRELVRHDNFQPPGGVGLAHAYPDLGELRAAGVGQDFADAVLLTLYGDRALTAIIERVREGGHPGVDATRILRCLPAHPLAQALAIALLPSQDLPSAAAAAAVLGDAHRAFELAEAGRGSDEERVAALDLALELEPAEAERRLLQVLDRGGALVDAAVERAGRIGGERLTDRLVTDVHAAPAPRLPAYARAFAALEDPESGRWLGEAFLSEDAALRAAAADALRTRRPGEASEAVAGVLGDRSRSADAVELLGLLGTLEAVEPLLELAGRSRGSDRDDMELAVTMIQDRYGDRKLGGLAMVDEGGGLALAVEEGALSEVAEPAVRRPRRERQG